MASTELQKAGEDTDGVITSTSKLADKVKALTNIDGKGGFNILNDDGTFKSTKDMIEGIGAAFEKMDKSSTNSSALIELLFGKNRANAGVALLDNYKKIEEVLATIEQDENSAEQENQRYVDSIEGHLNQLKNAWAELWDNTLSKDFIKSIIDLGTRVLGLVKNVGLLRTTVGLLLGIGLVKRSKTIATAIGNIAGMISKLKESGVTAKKVFELLFGSLENFESVGKLKKTFEEAKKSVEGLTIAEEAETKASQAETVQEGANATANTAEAATEELQTVADKEHTAAQMEGIAAGKGEQVQDAANAATNAAEASSEMAQSTTQATTGMLGMAEAGTGLTAVFGSLTPLVVGLGVVAVAGGAAWLIYSNSLAKAEKDLKKSTQAFEEQQQKVESLTTELQTQQEELDALKAKGSLTYVEKEQLEDLKEATAEMREQLKIEQQQEIKAAKEKADDEITVIDKKYGDLSNIEDQISELKETAEQLGNGIFVDGENDIKGLLAQYDEAIKMLDKAKAGDEDVLQGLTVDDYKESVQDWEDIINDALPDLMEKKKELKEYLDLDSEAPQKYKDYYNELSDAIASARKRVDSAQWNTDQYDEMVSSLSDDATKKLNELLNSGNLDSSTITQVDGLTDAIQNLDLVLDEGKDKTTMFLEQFTANSDFGQAVGRLTKLGLGDELSKSIVSGLDSDKMSEIISGDLDDAIKSAIDNVDTSSIQNYNAIHELFKNFSDSIEPGSPNLGSYYEEVNSLAQKVGVSVWDLNKAFNQSRQDITDNVDLVNKYNESVKNGSDDSTELWNQIKEAAKEAGVSTEDYLKIYSSSLADEATTSLDEIKQSVYDVIDVTEGGKTKTTLTELLGMSYDSDNTISKYIDDLQTQVTSLEETYDKLATSTSGLSDSEVIDLIQEFPELASKIDEADSSNTALKQGIKELEQQKIQALIDQLEQFGGVTEEDQAAIDILRQKIDDLDYTNPLDFSDTAGQLSTITAGLSGITSAMQTLAEGTALTKGQLVDLVCQYPELLKQEKLFETTTVSGQQAMLQSIVDMNEQKYDAAIEEKIQELEAGKEVVKSQIKIETQKLNALQQLDIDYKNGQIENESDLNDKLTEIYDLEGKNYVSYKNGELDVNEDALNKQLENTNEMADKSAPIWGEESNMITQVYKNGVKSSSVGLTQMVEQANSFGSKMFGTLKQVASGFKDAFSGKGLKESFKATSASISSIWKGSSGGSGSSSGSGITYNSPSDISVGGKDLSKFVADYQKTVKLRIKDLNKLTSDYDIEIDNLKKLKGLDLGDILKTSGGSKSSKGKNSKDSSKFSDQIDWAANSIENLTRKLERLQKVLDNTDSAKKQISTLKQMIGLQQKLVTANQKATSTYQTVYQLALKKIPKKYRKKYQSMIESDQTFSYQTFSGKSDGKENKLYDSVKAAQDAYKTWQEAKDATTEAKEQLKEYAQQLIDVPWDAAQKKVEKLNSSLDVLDAKLSSATSYEEKNKILEQQLKLQEKIVATQKEAVSTNEKDLNTYRKALKAQTKSEEKQVLKSIDKKYKQKSDYNKDGTLKVDSKASATQKKYINQYNALVKRENAIGSSGVETVTTTKKVKNTSSKAYKEAKANLKNEFTKLADWGLGEYKKALNSKYVQGKDTFVQTVFGNINMDKRKIITWSSKLKKTYKDALKSWNYNPENGSIDTVFGSSSRFGEDLNVNNHKGYEIAFSPILQTKSGAKFLDKDTVNDYINAVLKEAAKDGKVTKEEILKIDAKGVGKKAGKDLIKGLIAEVDAGTNYGKNGLNNKAVEAGMLMHFSGKYGAISLAQKELKNASTKTVKTTKTKQTTATIPKTISTKGVTDPKQLALINQYNAAVKELKENVQELTKAEEEYKTTYRDNIKSRFDNIQADYDRVTNIIDKKNQAVEDSMSLAESKGYGMSSAYYQKQISYDNQKLKKNKEERKKLIAELKKQEIGSDQWYEMRSALYDLDSETKNLTKDMQDLNNTIEELDWSNFDNLLSMITDVADETTFLKDLMSSEDMFDDNGQITSAGLATMGLSAQNYDMYMAQADKIAQKIKDLDAQYANDKYNSRYLEERQKLVKAQQDNIKSANSEKQAINDLVKEGLDAEYDALEKLVEAKKKALETEKDSYEWQKKIKQQTKSITDLERQIAALEGDSSGSNKKKLRELKASLKDAQDELSDSLYDKSIEDQENSLQDMLDKSSAANEEYLKNSDQVFADSLVKINANSSVIGNQIEQTAQKVGYDVSSYISDAWTDSTNAVTAYGDQFTLTSSTVMGQINNIALAWQAAIDKANEYAKASLNASDNEQKDYSSTTGKTSEQLETQAKLKTAKEFIKTHAVTSKKSEKEYKAAYGALNEYLYENNNKKVLSLEDEQTLATNLGFSPWVYTDWRKKVANWLKKNSAFSVGGVIDASMIKSTGEDGLALVKHKEALLTVEQTKMFKKFVSELPTANQFIDSIVKSGMIPNVNNSSNNATYNITSQVNVDGVATNEIVSNLETIATKQAENVVAKINRKTYSKGVRK